MLPKSSLWNSMKDLTSSLFFSFFKFSQFGLLRHIHCATIEIHLGRRHLISYIVAMSSIKKGHSHDLTWT